MSETTVYLVRHAHAIWTPDEGRAPESTPWQELWAPLPEPHRSAMREGLACLLANGILLGAERRAVAINPICMDEIEQFITRNITPVWERVLVRA